MLRSSRSLQSSRFDESHMDSGLVNLGTCVVDGVDLGARCFRLRERYLSKVSPPNSSYDLGSHSNCDLKNQSTILTPIRKLHTLCSTQQRQSGRLPNVLDRRATPTVWSPHAVRAT
jgi:hypothetical protein